MTDPKNTQCSIAVVGVSALFPGSTNAGGFWTDILAGRDMIRDVPETHWLAEDYYDADTSVPDKTYGRRGAYLDAVPFAPLDHGVPPSIVPATDTSQLLALIVAQRVLQDAAQGQFEHMDRERISVILGATSSQELLNSMVSRLQRPVWVKALRDAGLPESKVQEACDRISDHYVPWQESTFPGLLGNVIAGRIANRMDLGGTNCVTDAACASSFSAVSMAVDELLLGRSDLVISGGVDTMSDIFMQMCFSQTPALSPTGDCRPFSDQADGTILGEGLGMVALKRLEDAERDGDRIYAVLKGVGTSSDGRSKSVYAPVPEGQAKALGRAYEVAGYAPSTVELVEAHGTGTKAGDAAEFQGLTLAFDASGREDRGWCAVGSVKSQIGHTKAAAGAAGLFKVVMALQHGVLPPTIKVPQTNPKMKLAESPFYVNTEARPWVRGSDHPRRASVSSFGFGGSNFHLALEAYEGDGNKAWRKRTAPTEVVLFGAESSEALTALVQGIDLTEPGTLRYLARSTQEGWSTDHVARLAVVASDETELQTRLAQAVNHIATRGDENLSLPGVFHYTLGAEPGDVAFLFPGQGSQFVGMGAHLAMTWSEALRVWDGVADMDLGAEERLHEVVFPRPVFSDEERAEQAARLTSTQWAQPALGVTSMASLELMRTLGVTPQCVGGHSFGEVTALHAAGVLDRETAVRVARRRGELMAEAASIPGAMTAAVSDIETVQALVDSAGLDVVVANHNAPRQVVLSGPTEAIEGIEEALKEAEITARRLPVATAFHSHVVSGSTEPFLSFLGDCDFQSATLPVYANSLGDAYPEETDEVRRILGEQIAKPVRFVDQLEAMYAAGARTFIEVGPGSVLTRLVGQVFGDKAHQAISTDQKGKHGVTALNDAIGRMATAGLSLDLAPLWTAYAPIEDPRQAEKPAFTISICGSNYGKPYPPPGGAADLPAPNPEVVDAPPASAPTLLPHAGTGATPDAAWLATFQELQRQTFETHARFQESMIRSHESFLAAAQTSLAGLQGAVGGATPEISAPSWTPPAPVMPPAPVFTAPPTPVAAAPVTTPPAPVSTAVPPSAPSAPSVDLAQALLSVVSEKTGYPVEMLGMHMALETDLGVDSIKRVEILSEIKAQVPSLPDLDPTKMATLETLGEIDTYIQGVAGETGASVVPATPASTPAPVAQATSSSSVDLGQALLTVVAEKTGYPLEMLGMHMALETDLGVDSIKRVEILSEIRAQVPSLPELDPTKMATLETLGEIDTYIQGVAGDVVTPVAAAPVASAAPVAQTTPVPSVDLGRALLTVVAEKTGYPLEMLGMHMALETDLGVDSIKRVEILSEIRTRVPSLPELDPTKMATLETLGEIDAYIQDMAGQGVVPPAAAPPTQSVDQGPSVDLGQALLAVVAEKTGYPLEMLGMHMALETDLGVDSIKRVEILSEIRTRVPSLPELDPTKMATLETLGEIDTYIQTMAGQSSTVAAGAPENAEIPDDPSTSPVGRHLVVPAPAPAIGLAMAGLACASEVIVTEDEGGVAEALVAALDRRGIHARTLAVVDVPADAEAVVYLGGLCEDASPERAMALSLEVLGLARTIAPTYTERGGVFLVVQDTGGDFGLLGSERAWLASPAGLAKTAALEWPEASVRALDLERGDRGAAELGEALADELVCGGTEVEVGLRANGLRVTLTTREVPATGGTGTLGDGSVIVASGGARGVTAATLVALARSAQPRLVLLGRTALEDEPKEVHGLEADGELKSALLKSAKDSGETWTPVELGSAVRRIRANREIRQTLEQVKAAGSEVRYLSVDVTDQAALSEALSGVRADWGPITGIIHGAGVLADKLIAEKTDDQARRVLATKVRGLHALLGATTEDPLRLIGLFSSVAARSGNRGQSDYAMANEILNKVAWMERARRGSDCVVKAFGWGPWQGGMVTPELEGHFRSMGVALIPLQTGAKMLVDEFLNASPDSVELVLGAAPHPNGLGPVDEVAEVRMDLVVSATSHPYLADHSIEGVPVVPVVLALEWFARLAEATRPDLDLVGCRDLQVLRGIRLNGFENGGDRFTLRCKQVSNGDGALLEMDLRSADGVPHYRALADMERRAREPASFEPPDLKLEEWTSAVYGDPLFHGPEFQVIRSLDGVSTEGMQATMMGVREAGWGGGAWKTDAAALDGGLQLALLWTDHVLGGRSLPTSVKAYRAYKDAVPDGPVRCTLRGRIKGKSCTACDITFTTDDGSLVAELLGVETHRLPGQRAQA